MCFAGLGYEVLKVNGLELTGFPLGLCLHLEGPLQLESGGREWAGAEEAAA